MQYRARPGKADAVTLVAVAPATGPGLLVALMMCLSIIAGLIEGRGIHARPLSFPRTDVESSLVSRNFPLTDPALIALRVQMYTDLR